MSILKDILDSFRRGGGLTKSYCNNQDKRYSVTFFWTSYVNKKYSKIVIEKEKCWILLAPFSVLTRLLLRVTKIGKKTLSDNTIFGKYTS